jgi:hypothetical protein
MTRTKKLKAPVASHKALHRVLKEKVVLGTTDDNSGVYSVVLETSGRKYKSDGDTIAEAIERLSLEWHHIKAKGIIRVSHGNKTYEHLFYLRPLKKIFANKMTRLVWGKRLTTLLETA